MKTQAKITVTFFRIAVCLLSAVLISITLFSCSGKENGKKELVSLMNSDYVADVEYLLEAGELSVCGEARITRNENVRIDILSPDPYTGLSVQGDALDKASVISLEYSGIKAEVPKNALEKINIILSMFSDSAATQIQGLKNDEFTESPDEYTLAGHTNSIPYEVKFSKGDIEYIYIYDSVSGVPLSICAKSGGTAVQIKIKKLKTAE